jgi:RimJ/RimL family protein N-acetyltransferase
LRQSALIATREGRALGWVNRYGAGAATDACKVGIDICEDEFLNRGFGTEALTLWIDYLFANSSFHRIGLDTWSLNPRMVRVAGKLGFVPEGAEREQLEWRGERLDFLHFGLLRSEWERRRTRA